MLDTEIKDALEYYQREYYIGTNPIACELFNLLNDRGVPHAEHNCIGCNIARIMNHIKKYMEVNKDEQDTFYFYQGFIHLTYIMVERIKFVFDLFKQEGILNEGGNFIGEYQYLGQIIRWENFFKHPKSFMLVHHPEYTFHNSEIHQKAISELDKWILVDTKFINKFYKGEHNKKILERELCDKVNVVVVFPKIKDLLIDVKNNVTKFIDIIKANEEYIGLLRNRATCLDYHDTKEYLS